jgi:hypothetical protein
VKNNWPLGPESKPCGGNRARHRREKARQHTTIGARSQVTVALMMINFQGVKFLMRIQKMPFNLLEMKLMVLVDWLVIFFSPFGMSGGG